MFSDAVPELYAAIGPHKSAAAPVGFLKKIEGAWFGPNFFIPSEIKCLFLLPCIM